MGYVDLEMMPAQLKKTLDMNTAQAAIHQWWDKNFRNKWITYLVPVMDDMMYLNSIVRLWEKDFVRAGLL